MVKKDESSMTPADKIWEKIRELPINIFALPGQTVEMHVKRVDIIPDKCHLILKSSAALPAIEESIVAMAKIPQDQRWNFEQSARYTLVSIEPKEA